MPVRSPLYRQRWLGVLAAAGLTLGTLLLLPLTAELDSEPEPDTIVRQVDPVSIHRNAEDQTDSSPAQSQPAAEPKPSPLKTSTPEFTPGPTPSTSPAELAFNLGAEFQTSETPALSFNREANATGLSTPNYAPPAAGPEVYDLEELDTAPRPVVQTPPAYPFKARQRGIEGYVDIQFRVTSAGIVEHVQVVDSTPPGVFEDAARRAVKSWKFKPAVKNDQAVPAQLSQRIKFKLQK